jgi:hypothetical protein
VRGVVEQSDQPPGQRDAERLEQVARDPASFSITLVELDQRQDARGRAEIGQRTRDRLGDVGPALLQPAGELPVARDRCGEVLPAPGALELVEEILRTTEERVDDRGIRLQPDQLPHTAKPRGGNVRRTDAVANERDRRRRVIVE